MEMRNENELLLEKMNILEKKIDSLSSELFSHIEFINKTYELMKYPLLFFCDTIDELRQISFPFWKSKSIQSEKTTMDL